MFYRILTTYQFYARDICRPIRTNKQASKSLPIQIMSKGNPYHISPTI